MWEGTIGTLAAFDVASDPAIEISGVLDSIDKSLKKCVPREWGVKPHLKVSNLTREHLRKVVTAFIATGDGDHAAPFYRQGTGTINMLVLAMLSQIAEDTQHDKVHDRGIDHPDRRLGDRNGRNMIFCERLLPLVFDCVVKCVNFKEVESRNA
ncbi:hypothetical protein [Sphingobium sp. YR768]|uniref:hypothetical protein n=1 Tax=Sphingobium sp. YR768 TaxID=1884365 RepID=UPI0008BBF38C|nr:hypothetical protein [Sphingobium sp. YR768]SER22770.1 hypothetical protein SAMN05518866_1079 [Sphingobium sp. YR768]